MTNSAPQFDEIISTIKDIIPLLIPIILIQWSLMVFALVKLFKAQSEPKYLPRWLWAIIIIFVNLIGSIIYLTVGRSEE